MLRLIKLNAVNDLKGYVQHIFIIENVKKMLKSIEDQVLQSNLQTDVGIKSHLLLATVLVFY